MSNLEDHDAEQAAITRECFRRQQNAASVGAEPDHPEGRTIQDIELAYLDLNVSPETRCNKDRAAEGALICDFMQYLTGTDETQDQIADTICQLMHFCSLSRFDFDAAVTSAKMNFDAEIEEEKP